MIVLVEDRAPMADALHRAIERTGQPCVVVPAARVEQWWRGLGAEQRLAIGGLVVAAPATSFSDWAAVARDARPPPILAVLDQPSLEATLALFAHGADDVMVRPIEPRELLARLHRSAARVRLKPERGVGAIVVFADGRDPLVGSQPLDLPRRERRVLECLVAAHGGWVSKSTLSLQVYGAGPPAVSASVVECHVSRLRRRLRERLGHDRLQSRRYLGYRLDVGEQPDGAPVRRPACASPGRRPASLQHADSTP
jgi:DNA-binding response OmpR family regulator